MTPQEQFLDMIEKTRPIRGVNVREVAGGYSVVGSTRYADKVTGGIQHEAHEEGVAADVPTVIGMMNDYLVTGTFAKQLAPMPLFDAGTQFAIQQPLTSAAPATI